MDKFIVEELKKYSNQAIPLKSGIFTRIFVKKTDNTKRVSFDLDEVLFVDPSNHRTEPPLPFPFNRIFKERLRLGTPELIRSLQALGYDV